MEIKIYNTLSRKKDVFKPLEKGKVGIYSCGPTVYWYQHIGNLRSYLSWDFLKRTFILNDYKVKHVINVTDVGHLTSDADEGEDKMERASQREGKSAKEISNYYFKVFREDLDRLNVIPPEIWCKATEHIKEQIELIKVLEKKGYTYQTSDGIYFDTSKLKDYGKLAKIRREDLKAGKRISLGEKKNKTDFALWKFSEERGKRQQEWESPWGIGFPGWHIECSAMSSKYLGKQFDIHTGGQDHIPVHHTNEIAQSEAAYGKKPWVKYWVHGAWLLFKGEKMAKSKGDIFTLSKLEDNGFNAMEFRYMCLTTHYRKPLNFTDEKIKKSQEAYKRLKNIIAGIEDDKKEDKKYIEDFTKAVNNDINMPEALQILWKLVRDEKAEGKISTIKKMDEILGLDLLKKEKIKIPEEIKKLVREREEARKNKDWKKSDELREKIRKKGYVVEDNAGGSIVKKI